MFQEIPFPFTIPFACGGRTAMTGISTYSIMLVSAFLTASYFAPRELKRRNLNPEVTDWCLLIGVISAIVGSKVGFVFEVWDHIWIVDKSFSDTLYYVLFKFRGMGVKYPGQAYGLWETLISGGGLVFYGGLIFAFSSIFIYLKLQKLEARRYADAFMPSVAIGYAIGRLGCLISGDGCYGYAAPEIPLLTMVYEPLSFLTHGGIAKWNTPVQPSMGVNVWNTPLIESIASFGLFVFLMKWGRYQNFRPGMLVAILVMFNGVSRFMVEFLRVNDAVIPIIEHPPVSIAQRYTAEGLNLWHWYGITQSQLVALGLIILGMAWIIGGKLYIREKPAEEN